MLIIIITQMVLEKTELEVTDWLGTKVYYNKRVYILDAEIEVLINSYGDFKERLITAFTRTVHT